MYDIWTKHKHNGHHATVTIWPNGFRASYPLARRPTKRRVLLLGGSYTMGEGVEDDQTYAWYLNEEYRNITFDNAGVNGFGTYQCLLLEKRILDELPKGYYDLVIYAPIEDHIGRNETYTQWDFENKVATEEEISKYWPGTELLQSRLDPMWYFPRAHLKEYRTIEYSPVVINWPGDRYLATVNLAKRLYIYHQTCKIIPRRFDSEARALYKLLVEKMYNCALQHNSKFVTLCLEDSDNMWLYHINTPAYPYYFVTVGREGKPLGPEFCVGGKLNQHPSPIVHKNWAKHIKQWIDTYKPFPDIK